jgi:5,10-methylenetetrahydromethanopterin reductase
MSMDFGVCVASNVTDMDYVVRAEELGYSHAWLADSQMLWSDCYATLALAATRTETIRLGTGVAVTGTRPAPVTAASIGTINAIAPGRTFLGIGAGNTAMRVMGKPPHRIREYDAYLTELKPLLSGEESVHDGRPIRHIMQETGFVNFSDPIPLYVSGFGPRSLAVAGKHGDGAVLGGAADPAQIAAAWHSIESGAREVGRSIDRNEFYLAALTSVVMLEDGEPADSERIKRRFGGMVLAGLHYTYDQFRNFGHQPPAHLHGIWDEYRAYIERYPEDVRHQYIHGGHCCWAVEEEQRFLTAEVMQAAGLIGTPDELRSRLAALHAAGLDQVIVMQDLAERYEVLEELADALIGQVD